MLLVPKFDFFRNGEFIKYISNVITISKGQDLKTLQVQAQVEQLEKTYDRLIWIYKENRGSFLTKEIAELDRQRDQAFIGLRWITYYCANYHHQESIREQANTLLNTLDKHGLDVTKKSYQEQGAALDDIIAIISASDDQVQSIHQLHLKEWFDQLKLSTQTFDQKYLERNQEYAKAPKEKLQDLRDEAAEAYRELIRFITAYATINPGDNYQYYIDQLNQVTESYNLTVTNRRGTNVESEALDEDLNDLG